MSETIAQSSNDSYAVSVGTSALVLVEGSGQSQSGAGLPNRGGTAGFHREVTVHNSHATQLLYVGWGSDVSAASGLTIPAGAYKVFLLVHTDEMWAIASGASTDARVSILHGKGNPA